MKVKIINQGLSFEENISLGAEIHKILVKEKIDLVVFVTAFTSESMVNNFLKIIDTSKTQVRFITGVDQKGTSKEALYSLLHLRNIEKKVYYNPNVNIFHPKIYLLQNKSKSYLFIGSNNFTRGGMFQNIESSIMLELDNNSEDFDLIKCLKTDFPFIDNNEIDCLYDLSEELIEKLVDNNLLPSAKEIVLEILQSNRKKAISTKDFEKSPIPRIPDYIKGNSNKNVSKFSDGESIIKLAEARESNFYRSTLPKNNYILWQSSPLTERDLNIPTGSNTNVTGDINLDRGNMDGDVDFRHFYREEVFKDLIWNKSLRKGSTHLEEAIANFQIIVDGKDFGIYKMKISHNPLTTTKTYLQKNAVTKLKWGEVRSIIANKNFLGKTMTIKASDKVNTFIIAIG